MHFFRVMLAAVLLVAGSAIATPRDDADWQIFGRLLSVVQSIVHAATVSNDPQTAEKRIDSLLSGENAEANGLAKDIAGDVFEDIPPQYKSTAMSLARDLATFARKERAREAYRAAPDTDSALRARKDLAGMGLRHFDASQLLDAVKRDDLLAVELFVVARGVDFNLKFLAF